MLHRKIQAVEHEKERNNKITRIKKKGTSLIDTVFENIAFYACTKNIDLSRATAEINHYIKLNSDEIKRDPPCLNVLFYLGLLSEVFGLKEHELFTSHTDKIEEYFINAVIEMTKNIHAEFSFEDGVLTISDDFSGNSILSFSIHREDKKTYYLIDVYFYGEPGDFTYNNEYLGETIIPLAYNVVCKTKEKRLIKAYSEAEDYYERIKTSRTCLVIDEFGNNQKELEDIDAND